MSIARIWHSIRLMTITSSVRRADYVRRNHLFHYCGENVRLPAMRLPYRSELISIHNNVEVASGVTFSPHDAVYSVLSTAHPEEERFPEKLGCIEIMDNVFIGANSTILGNVRIGPNVIVGAMSLVNRDLPEGTVCVGVPAKPIGSFEGFVQKRRKESSVSVEEHWRRFEEKYKENK